jgi:hypothetical protein
MHAQIGDRYAAVGPIGISILGVLKAGHIFFHGPEHPQDYRQHLYASNPGIE